MRANLKFSLDAPMTSAGVPRRPMSKVDPGEYHPVLGVVSAVRDGAMWKVEDRFRVKLGGNTYINTPRLIVYKGTPLFQLGRSESDGMLGIDFDVFDAAGQRVCIF